ncbi:MAG: ribonuclease [Sphingomonadaceae bacterium]
MAEWIYERGIGEERAALVEDGAIIEAHIISDDVGLRAGSVVAGRLIARHGIVRTGSGEEVVVRYIRDATEGAAVNVMIVREAVVEPGADKRAKGAITDAPLRDGPDLLTRLGETGIAVRALGAHDEDALEGAGWSECLEEAARGIVAFPGGTLRISLTPAMTLIDIDGTLALDPLAIAGAQASAAAIRRFGLAGNIGIDLPTVAKPARMAAAAAFDAALPLPFERTAINGFGFLQVILPRARASLCEVVQHDRSMAEARALLRRTQRSAGPGPCTLTVTPAVAAVLTAHPAWLSALSSHLGGAVTLESAR